MQYLTKTDDKEVSTKEEYRSGDKCMIASGKCIEHDSSVVRAIAVRKKNVLSRNGDVNWKKCYFVSLVCPVA